MAKKILFQTELTDTDSSDLESVGVLREDEKGNIYRWVKNGESTALAAGQTVMYDAGNAGSSLYESVVDDATAASEDVALFAGIAMSAIPSEEYGWILVDGYYSSALCDEPGTTAIAIGDILVPSASNNYLDYAVGIGTAPTYVNHCVALEAVSTATPATATTTTIKVLVRGQ